MTWNDEDEDESAGGHGIEDPDETDMNDDPGEVICPYCKREIMEDLPQCPYCGSYFSAEDAPHKREWWWVVALVLLILLLLVYVLRRA